jgi:hypothetical protein
LVYTGALESIETFRLSLPITEEWFEDASPAVVALIEATARWSFLPAMETAVLDGVGGAGHILGLLRRPGVPATRPAQTTALASVLGAIADLGTRTGVMADAVLANGVGWAALRHETGGTWDPSLPPLFLTRSVPADTAVVGAFHVVGVLLDRQLPVEGELTKAHGPQFTSDVLTLRLHARLGFNAFRPDLVQPVALPTTP